MIPLGWEPGRARPRALPGLLKSDRRIVNIMSEIEQTEDQRPEAEKKSGEKPAKK